jgi:hypothetical protein
MFIDLFILNIPVIMVSFIVFVAGVLSLCGFIGNVNINSGDGNVSITGADIANEFAGESVDRLDSGNANSIKVSNPVGNVVIKASDSSEVVVNKKLFIPKVVSEEEKSAILKVFTETSLTIIDDVVNLDIPRISIMNMVSAKVDIDVSLPKQLNYKQLSGVNNTEISNIIGSVDLDTNAGNVKLSSLVGNISVNINSGNFYGVELKAIKSVNVNAGNLSLSKLSVPSGSVKIFSQVGNVEVDIDDVSPDADCKIESNTGELLVMINREANAKINASTSMGKLNIDSDIKIISKEDGFMGGSMVGSINNGGGTISLSSNMGSVKVGIK